MSSHLVDTSVLGRLANTNDALYQVAARAVMELHRRGENLHTTPQVLIEFRNVATRPASVNGLGLPPDVAEIKAAAFESTFPLLPETPDIFPVWKDLVQSKGVTGKQVHDARLVAVCHVHSIRHILTFNDQHFSRYSDYGPGLNLVNPSEF